MSLDMGGFLYHLSILKSFYYKKMLQLHLNINGIIESNLYELIEFYRNLQLLYRN